MSDKQIIPYGWSTITSKNDNIWYHNIIYNFVTKQKPKTQSVIPENWITVQSKTKNIPYFYNTKTKKSCWFIPLSELKECHIKGLLWVGNSCYMDSVLVALFSNPSVLTDSLIHEPVTEIAGKLRCGKTLKDDISNRKLIRY